MRTRKRPEGGDASANAEELEKGCICGLNHDEDNVKISSTKEIDLFWLQCDACQAWYNVSSTCAGFTSSTAASAKKLPSWTCVDCVRNDDSEPPMCRSEEDVDMFTPCYPLIVAVNYPLWYANRRSLDGTGSTEGGNKVGAESNANGSSCICGLTHEEDDNGNDDLFWLKCDACQSWYKNDAKCIGITEDEAKMLDKWDCPRCTNSARRQTSSSAGGEGHKSKKAKKEEFVPGHICDDAVFYCTIDDETCADVAAKLGGNWRNVAIANKDRYGKIRPDSKFEEGTLLLLPKQVDPDKIVALQKPKDVDHPQDVEDIVDGDGSSIPAESTKTFLDDLMPGKTDSKKQCYCTLDDESCALVAQKLGCTWQDLAGANRERYGRTYSQSRFREQTILTIPPEHDVSKVENLCGAVKHLVVSPSPKQATGSVKIESPSPHADSKLTKDIKSESDFVSGTNGDTYKGVESTVGDDDCVKNAVVATEKQNEAYYPGYVSKDMLYYATLENETPKRCAAKLGCQCSDLVNLNRGTYKGLTATSALQEGTMLEIPLATTEAAVKKLEALYHYEDKLAFCCECYLLEERDGPPMLLCDGCDKACHLPCAPEGLTEVPKGDWYCRKCCSKRKENAGKGEDSEGKEVKHDAA